MRFPADVPELRSGDITLRAHTTADIPAVVEQCADPDSIRWTTVPLDYSEEMARAFVTEAAAAAWETSGERLFAIESTHPDGVRRFSGSVSLRDEGDRRAEVAFGAHPAIRGRGVMTTAVNLLLDYGFAECDIETVVWRAVVGNVGSRRVAWKAGFSFAGVAKRWLVHRGEYLDAWAGTLHRGDPRKPTTSWIDAPVIVGENLKLRPLVESDIPRIVETSNDERTQHWLTFLPAPFEAEHARRFITDGQVRASGGVGVDWAVADLATDRVLGTIGLPRKGAVSWEIGYAAHPDARGRGVMREAVALVTGHVFRPVDKGGLGARRAFIKAAAGNTASRRVAEANGYRETGRDRQAEPLRDGTFDDLVTYDLLADEWSEMLRG